MSAVLTPKQRVLRTIRRQEIDRLPTQIDFSGACQDKMTKHWGLRGDREMAPFLGNHIIYAYMNDAVGNIKARQAGQGDISYDDWGTGFQNVSEGPSPVSNPLADMSWWASYQFPDPDKSGLFDRAEEAVNTFGNEYLVTSYQIFSLFERAWLVRGFENFMMDMAQERDFAETLLDKIADYSVRIAERYVQAGVSCGRVADDYGGKTGMLFSPAMWRALIKPRLKRIFQVYQDAGIPVLFHSCGHIVPIMGDLVEMGVNILNPVQPDAMDIGELKANYGASLVFYGGISTSGALPFGTPAEVREDVRHAVEILGKGGGYIVAPAQGVTSEVSAGNIEALRLAVAEFATCM